MSHDVLQGFCVHATLQYIRAKFQDDRSKLLVIDLDEELQIEMSDGEKIDFVTSRILREQKAVFEALAK